jgi:hypothetical protein
MLLYNIINYLSAVGIKVATGNGLGDRRVGVRVPAGSTILTSPYRPDQFWGPSASHPTGTGSSFPGGKAAGA